MKNKLGILIHPVNRELLYAYEPGMRNKSLSITKKLLEWMSPFKVSDIEGIYSLATFKKIEAELIMCPLLLEQMFSLNPRKVLRRVIKTAKFAQARGVSLLGLAAYTAMVGRRGLRVQEALDIPVTTGANMSLATIPEALFKAINILGYTPEKMNILIIGLTHVSEIIVNSLGYSVKKIYLYASNREKTEVLNQSLNPYLKKKIERIKANLKFLLPIFDLVAIATNYLPGDFKPEHLKKGAIVLDSSYPRRIKTSREDILILDGVSMIPPGQPYFNFNFGLPEGLCFPCMAEPIVLALEDKWVSYSLGKDISLDKAQKIFKLALKHGFKIGPLTVEDGIIPPEKIAKIKENINIRKKPRISLAWKYE